MSDPQEDSVPTPCAVCQDTPCYYMVHGEAVCSWEHGYTILCGSLANIVPVLSES